MACNTKCQNHPRRKAVKGNIYCSECLEVAGKQLYMQQGGRCAICGVCLFENDLLVNAKVPSSAKLDHDHKSGQLRGVLCNECNRGLGLFNDDANLLQAAISYLNLRKTTQGRLHSPTLVF